MSLVMIKIMGITPIMMIGAFVVKIISQKKEDLYAQRISWDEYEMLRQGASGLLLILFLCAGLIAL